MILCSIPGQEFPDASFIDIPHFDKIVHFGLYFILSLVTIKGFYLQSSSTLLQQFPYLITLIYGTVLGLILELIQHHYIPFRSGDPLDLLANILGAITGAIGVHFRIVPRYFLLKN
ncbi:MAG: VanZ family protein [Flavobacteriales bacterium]|nr:VanZ family protein [Flavobacteriales bacterium]